MVEFWSIPITLPPHLYLMNFFWGPLGHLGLTLSIKFPYTFIPWPSTSFQTHSLLVTVLSRALLSSQLLYMYLLFNGSPPNVKIQKKKQRSFVLVTIVAPASRTNSFIEWIYKLSSVFTPKKQWYYFI